jgi:hypothetical protein
VGTPRKRPTAPWAVSADPCFCWYNRVAPGDGMLGLPEVPCERCQQEQPSLDTPEPPPWCHVPDRPGQDCLDCSFGDFSDDPLLRCAHKDGHGDVTGILGQLSSSCPAWCPLRPLGIRPMMSPSKTGSYGPCCGCDHTFETCPGTDAQRAAGTCFHCFQDT